MDNVMDNENTTTDLATGTVVPFMYAGEMADEDNGYEVDDTVNIPYGEYEELIEDSMFLSYLKETVGPDVWAQAESAYAQWNEEQEAAMDDGGTTF